MPLAIFPASCYNDHTAIRAFHGRAPLRCGVAVRVVPGGLFVQFVHLPRADRARCELFFLCNIDKNGGALVLRCRRRLWGFMPRYACNRDVI